VSLTVRGVSQGPLRLYLTKTETRTLSSDPPPYAATDESLSLGTVASRPSLGFNCSVVHVSVRLYPLLCSCIPSKRYTGPFCWYFSINVKYPGPFWSSVEGTVVPILCHPFTLIPGVEAADRTPFFLSCVQTGALPPAQFTLVLTLPTVD